MSEVLILQAKVAERDRIIREFYGFALQESTNPTKLKCRLCGIYERAYHDGIEHEDGCVMADPVVVEIMEGKL